MDSTTNECEIGCETLMRYFKGYGYNGYPLFECNDEVTRCLQVLESHEWGIHFFVCYETLERSYPRKSCFERKERESDEFFESLDEGNFHEGHFA